MERPNHALSLALIAVCGLIATAASAQTAATAQTATVTANAPIYVGAAVSATPLRVAAPGTVLRVLKEQGNWVQVEFNDPELGPRVGWVHWTLLKFNTEGLHPMDLSVPEAPPEVTTPPMPANPQTRTTLSPTTRRRERVWIDFNAGFATSAQSSVDTTYTWTLFYETARFDATYRSPTGASLDIGAGGMITETLGVGISFVGTAHMGPAQLSISIPHPRFNNANASDSNDTDKDLTRAEGATNVQIMFKPKMANSKLRFRVFGGPTYFTLQADAISNIRWDQSYAYSTSANTVKITTYDWVKAEAKGWGFHVGGDVSYFFVRFFGIGGFARYSLGTLTVNDDRVLANESVEVKVGGFQAGGGIRFRF